jgi:hypothetical protein
MMDMRSLLFFRRWIEDMAFKFSDYFIDIL